MRSPRPISILLILPAVGEHSSPEVQIRTHLWLTCPPVPGSIEVSEAFATIEERGLAVSLRDSLTGAIKWQITDEGRSALASRGL